MLDLRRLGVAAAFYAALCTPAAAEFFNPETFTLENGLQVVVIENHRLPIVTHMVWYKVGAADEAAGETGLAHFLEHLMFKGTDKMAPQEFSKIIAKNGGQDNAFTTQDYTAYIVNVARDRLELVMAMEADRMQNLKLTDEIVLPEREVVREERRMRIGNDPGSKMSEELDATLYMNLPYRRPVIGWGHEIEELTTEKALAFYREHYAPNNAILVISGDVTADEIRPLAEKYFGSIPPRDVPGHHPAVEPPHSAAKRVVLKDAGVNQPQWVRSYLAPSYNEGETDRVHALQVLAELLGGSTSSRLYRSLAVEKNLAAGVYTRYEASRNYLGEFTIAATPQPGVAIEDLEAAIDAEIAGLLDGGVTDEDVDKAKRSLIASAIYARDSVGGPARIFGTALATGGTVDRVESWPDRIEAVTADQVRDAALAVLRESNSATGILLPKPAS